MFAGEPFSGSAKASEDFVEDQHQFQFVREAAEQLEQFLWKEVDAAAALQWFDENCAKSAGPMETPNVDFDFIEGSGRRDAVLYGRRDARHFRSPESLRGRHYGRFLEMKEMAEAGELWGEGGGGVFRLG